MFAEYWKSATRWLVETLFRFTTPSFLLIHVVFLSTLLWGVINLIRTNANNNGEKKNKSKKLIQFSSIAFFIIFFGPIIGLGFLNHSTFDIKDLVKKGLIIIVSFGTTYIIPNTMLSQTALDFQADMVRYTELEKDTVVSHESLPILLGVVLIITAILLKIL